MTTAETKKRNRAEVVRLAREIFVARTGSQNFFSNIISHEVDFALAAAERFLDAAKKGTK